MAHRKTTAKDADAKVEGLLAGIGGEVGIAALRARLCRWYADHGRDLPWRRTRDPYAIWISEAMLQQTRVEVVRDAWPRFLARFPHLAALANATEDEVAAAWSGLGYYRRAQALRRAARTLVDDHGGVFPLRREELLALPGIGPYTAGAILSIAFARSEALVDGNVVRVLSRYLLLEAVRASSASERICWGVARALVPPESPGGNRDEVSPGNWNQALMELGALVCTPGAPDCAGCPLRAECAGRRAGRAAELPRKAPRRAPIEVRLEILLVRRGDRVQLRQRPDDGRMARLWELPTREITAGKDAPYLWPAAWEIDELEVGVELGTLTHAITRHRIGAVVRDGSLVGDPADAEGTRWCTVDELDTLALTGMARKALARFL